MTTNPRRLLLAVLVVGLLAFVGVFQALADGAGSPAQCRTPYSMSGGDNVQTYSAPPGWTVEGVCIKAGQLHTAPITEDTAGVCYSITGIGTRTAKVERTGTPGPSCQAISHVDVIKARTPATTTTTQPTTTTTEPTTTTTEATTTTTSTIPTTTTTEATTTTTAPEPTTTTTETPTTTAPSTTSTIPATSTTDAPPETLPFTGIEDHAPLLASIASALVLVGLIAVTWRRSTE